MVARLPGRSNGRIIRMTRLGSMLGSGCCRGLGMGFVVAVSLGVVLCFSGLTGAEVAYRNYTFDFFGNAVPAPQAYLPKTVITGTTLSVGELKDPQDLHVSRDGEIFIVDGGNSRLIWLDSDWIAIRVIAEFENDGKIDRLRSPEGVWAAGDGSVYVADTGNARVVVFDGDGRFVREIGPPVALEEGVIPNGFQYQPVKLAVDPANRLYVISRNSYEGLTVFNSDGSFAGFMGAPRVAPSAADLFWYRIATREQRERMALFIPTQFANLTLDSRGFVYVVEAGLAKDNSVRRLNPSGQDVLVRNGFHPPKGDLSGDRPSRLIDIHVQEDGIYRVLDHNNGRVFAYDRNGWLLYVFGASGELRGAFRDPVAVDTLGEDVLVLDRGQRQVVVFSPTNYARIINQALRLYNNGQYDESVEMWRLVLSYNSNYDLAYSGIGRAVLRQGDVEAALGYFRLGQDRIGYSGAFKQYRRELGLKHFGTALTLVSVALVLLLIALKLGLFRKLSSAVQSIEEAVGRRLGAAAGTSESRRTPLGRMCLAAGDLCSSLRCSLHAAIHPFEGFYEIRRNKRGNVAAAVVILGLMTLTYIIMRQYTGFIFNTRDLARLNIYAELASVLVPFLLWCVVNWALTTLMDGKGRLRDIFVSSAFALVPMIAINIPLAALTNFMTIEEGVYYYLMAAAAGVWTAGLLLIGNMEIHEYSAGKTAVTAGLTVVGMAFVLFLGVLFLSLVNTMIGFARGLYVEIIFR